MDHELHMWVNSDQDYFSGVQIYERYGRNPNLARLLRRGGATVKNRLTLSYELGKIAKQIAVSDNTPALVKPPVKQEIQKAELPVPRRVSLLINSDLNRKCVTKCWITSMQFFHIKKNQNE